MTRPDPTVSAAPTAPRPARLATAPGPVRLGRHLRALVRPWRARLVVIAVLVLVAAVVELVPPLVVRHVVDELTAGRSTGLGWAGLLYLGAAAAVAALSAGYGYLAATVAQRSLAGLRARLFAHLLVLPSSYHDHTPVGGSISRATADVEVIDDRFSSSAAALLGQLVRLATVAAAMTVLSPALTGAAALVVPPVVAISTVLRRRIRDAERASRTAVGAVNAQLAEDLSGVEVIRAFGREAAFHDRFRRALQGWLQAANRSVGFNAFYAPSLGVLAAAATAALLWLGDRNAFGAVGVSIGTLTAFVLLFGRFFTPLINLGDQWQTVQAALAGAERVFAVLDLPTDTTTDPAAPIPRTPTPAARPRPAEGVEPTRAGRAALELRRVSFGYTAARPVLHDVWLTVAPGEHVAVIGRTGAGKSSMLALLAGLYAPQTGQVVVGGTDPRHLDDTARRALLGFVPQAVSLFSGTVADNITLGDGALSSAQIHRAAQIAGADSFIAALPEGYATVLSDSARGLGVVLSAGQRQLLALARALVTTPAVLLLDEATAVIDGASDAAFRAALRQRVLPAGTAVLTVAHRLATARAADRVIVLSAGQIIEHGPPAALITTGGHFADLAALDKAGWDCQHDPDPPTR